MIKNISVIGLGKLGGTMAVCLAERGFNVVGYDISKKPVNAINKGVAPVYETGLQDLISSNRSRISATTDLTSALMNSQVSFVVVPTPSEKNGSFSLEHAIKAMVKIGKVLKNTITISIDPKKIRKVDRHCQTGSNKKVKKFLNYNPKYSLNDSIKNILNNFRK